MADNLSEESKKRAQAAKSYIENMLKLRNQNRQDRLERRSLVERQLQTETFSEEEKQNIIQELEQREREYTRFQRQRMSAADFEPLTVIGRGAFGEASLFRTQVQLVQHRHGSADRGQVQVRLCKEKATGKVVAVKKLQKSEMLRRGQVCVHV